nr:hypothetical protein [uncultured bacterium]
MMNLRVSFLSFCAMVLFCNSALTTAQTNADYAAVPPSSVDFDPPQIMLSLSRDHQYFFKAYNDYTDLDPEDLTDVDIDGNPNIETTYKHSFDYYGYFDSYKCYRYSNSQGRFNPQSLTGDKYCNGGRWSGNFLNWATMTRMDIVRSIFYGGSRSTDTGSLTVLQRTFLPADAHSFAKYYNGDDLGQLTPYSTTRTDGTNGGDNDDFDDMDEGLTLCNITYESSGTSQASTSPPLIRVAQGNHQLWAANERWQCTWDDEHNANSNANIPPSSPVSVTIGGNTILVDSGIDASSEDPAPGDTYRARVRACASNALIGTERCKLYPSGNLKPIGILQTYGDTGLISFGLMTGSYQNNIQGGVLRKNVSPFSDEVNVLTNGTFKYTATSDSIVRTLEKLRPWGYSYGDGTYIGGGQVDNCPFQLANIPNGQCKSWGNPISEIYKETIRYLAGLNPTSAFLADDSSLLTGLRTAIWNNPLDESTQCSGLNTIVINASVSSYDDDQTSIAGLPGGINGTSVPAGASTTNTWTDGVGADEGIHGKRYFVGRSGAATNEFCDAKTVSNLSNTYGLCPEAPTVSGSYAMAGIAHYAHNNDIRSDLDGNQTVNTFAISLATNTPTIRVPRTDGGQPVTILPAYRLLTIPDQGGGALVDFKIVVPHSRVGITNQFYAKYYVNWEDSEQGGDYDQDMWGFIEYVLDEGTNQIEIITTAVGQSTGTGQLFGFVTNGTTQDGFHAYSGILGANYVDPTLVKGCIDCRELINSFNGSRSFGGQEGPQSYTFSIAPNNASTLESPLYYAAKYGGFKEEDDISGAAALNASPEKVSEWDKVNNLSGAEMPDGLPDNYFFVINPQQLFDSLNRSLSKILSQDTAAGTSVANFANADGFANLVTQAFYREQITDVDNKEVTWTGELISYFIDDFGNFREDTNGNGQLDGYNVDKVFAFDLNIGVASDPSDDTVQIVYPSPTFVSGVLQFDDDGFPELSRDSFGNLTGPTVDVAALKAVWSAADNLSQLDNSSIKSQRPYSTAVPVGGTGASRHILTYMDTDLDGVVDSGETMGLLDTVLTSANLGFLGVSSLLEATSIVNYTRGYENPVNPLRNRTLKIDGTDRTYRLGDIVNSTPRIVGIPTQAYDTIYGDTSYTEFREQYKNRRHMVYVGGNDGLLHAFNVGFRRDVVLGTNDITVKYATNLADIGVTVTSHPLGSEVWAYAPYNLLPHLQWLVSGFYTHVFYMDGAPEVYEAKVFPDDADHPNGWGTILVIGMRLGGGDFPVNLSGGGTTTSRSAYVVLDVTNPEDPPVLMAEITHPDMNFTTSKPTLYYDCGSFCSNSNQSDNFNGEWKLIFGSGPNSIQNFDTNETAKIFTYDLETKALVAREVTESAGVTVANSFVGGLASRDWDNGETGSRDDDVVYFGTVGKRALVPAPGDVETGSVYRFRPKNSNSTNLLFDTDRPVGSRPLTLANESLGNFVEGSWVYFGTGVYNHVDDEKTNAQERYYGIREPVNSAALTALATGAFNQNRLNSDLLTYATVSASDLLDTTAVEVLNNDDGSLGASVKTGDLRYAVAGATTLTELRKVILTAKQGWYRDLPMPSVNTDPSSRVISDTAFLKTQIFFTSFQPDSEIRENICIGGLGESELYALNLTTGTASDFAALGIEGSATAGTAAASIDLGKGTAATPIVFTSEAIGGNKSKVITQKSTTESKNIAVKTGSTKFLRSGWRQIF